MSVEFVSVDRQILHEWEKAGAHAEACRQDWLRALEAPGAPVHIVQAAFNYAEAANYAEVARQRYENHILDQPPLPSLAELTI